MAAALSEPGSWGGRGPVAPPSSPPEGRLSPVSFGGILEITARLVRRHAGRLLALAVLFLLPAWLLHAAAGLQLVTAVLDALPMPPGPGAVRPPVTFTPEQTQRILDASPLLVATSLLVALAGALGGAAFSDVVERDYRGQRPSIRHAGARALRRLPAILGALVLSMLAMAALMLGGLMVAVLLVALGGVDPGGGGPGVFLALVALVAFVGAAIVLGIRWSLGIVIVALEEAGPLRALVRSWRLTAGAAWRTLGIVVLVTLVVAVIGGLLSEVLGLALADLIFGASTDSSVVVRTFISAFLSVAFAPVLPLALAVLYFDQRVRREAFDLSEGSRDR